MNKEISPGWATVIFVAGVIANKYIPQLEKAEWWEMLSLAVVTAVYIYGKSKSCTVVNNVNSTE